MKSTPLLTETHIAIYTRECVSIYHPDTGVRTIEEFVRRVGDLSEAYIENRGKPTEDDDKANAFKGDMLEVLAEIFFGAFEKDSMVGLTNYHPVPLSEDYGVDAIGVNPVGNKVAVQCKFRSNPSDAIEYGEISNTYTAGRIRHRLSLDEDDTIYVFTTCNSGNKHLNEVFGSRVRLIGRSIISIRIDNNLTFWSGAEQRIVATLNKLEKGE